MAKLTILILGENFFEKVLLAWKINRSIRIYTFKKYVLNKTWSFKGLICVDKNNVRLC